MLRRRSKRLVVVLLADSHAGHKLGLCNPETVLTDPNTGELYRVGLTAYQRYLWPLYEGWIQEVEDLADGCPVELIHNGDLAAGTKYMKSLCAQDVAGQVEIAGMNLAPLLRRKKLRVRKVRLVVGTPAHTLITGSMSVLVGTKLRADFPKLDVKSVYHMLHTVQGRHLDIAHHGPTAGTRRWLEGNAARYYLRSLVLADWLDNQIVLKAVMRAHYHEYHIVPDIFREGGREYETHLIIQPGLTGMDDYVRKVTKSKPVVDNGVVALEFEDGEMTVHVFHKKLDTRDKEVFDG